MSWRRWEEGENPAWPGLVDIFVFTMVFIMLLWFGTDWRKEKEELEKKVSSLETETAAYKSLIEDLQARINQFVEELAKVKGIITGSGKKELEGFFQGLQPKIDQQGFDPKINLDTQEITITGKKPIFFGTARYDLSKEDQQRLSSFAHSLYELLEGKPLYVLINGTADPRELRSSGGPPRDNTELSALRAATVAGLLEKAAPGLGRYLRIVGLGVKGETAPLAPSEHPDKFYQKYRTVELVIKVDVERVMQRLDQDGPVKSKGVESSP